MPNDRVINLDLKLILIWPYITCPGDLASLILMCQWFDQTTINSWIHSLTLTNAGASARSRWCFRAGDLSWQWLIKRSFTVCTCHHQEIAMHHNHSKHLLKLWYQCTHRMVVKTDGDVMVPTLTEVLSLFFYTYMHLAQCEFSPEVWSDLRKPWPHAADIFTATVADTVWLWYSGCKPTNNQSVIQKQHIKLNMKTI